MNILFNVSNNTIAKLLTLVSQYPDLYDDKSPNFRSSNKRSRIWEEIATKLKKRGLKAEACKKLWETQRKSYLHFKKSGTKPPSEKEKLFQKMTFLNNKNEGSGNQQPSNENLQQSNDNLQQSNDNLQQSNDNLQQSNENLQQNNENQQQANKNNLGPENKDEKQGGVQKEGPKTTPASAVIVTSTNSTQQYVIPSVQVNVGGVNVNLGSKNREKTPHEIFSVAKPKPGFGPQTDDVSMVDELALFTAKVQTDLLNLPHEFQIKAQGEMFQVLSKYKSMAHIATGGIGSSRTTM